MYGIAGIVASNTENFILEINQMIRSIHISNSDCNEILKSKDWYPENKSLLKDIKI